MRLVAYLRVSSDSQLDGFGLDVQERAVRTWARTHGHRIVDVHTDAGVSGATGRRQPARAIRGAARPAASTPGGRADRGPARPARPCPTGRVPERRLHDARPPRYCK